MTRPRGASAASHDSLPKKTSSATHDAQQQQNHQELSSMYDYLVKVILLGPSGAGKSCLLHRFVKNEWLVLSSQTIGVEFASKIIKVGNGSRRKRIKLQLWDTAGTERFRAITRSYYRGAAGAILVYDTTSHESFTALQPFLNDTRALASPNVTMMLVGNKVDLAQVKVDDESILDGASAGAGAAASYSSMPQGSVPYSSSIGSTSGGYYGANGFLGAQQKATVAPEGREVSATEASRWASNAQIPVTTEVSALNGQGVDEVFERLARMILTKIELGEIDPDDPLSGIQYGDGGPMGYSNDGASIRSGKTADESGGGTVKRRRGGGGGGRNRQNGGLRDLEVFNLGGKGRGRGCAC